MLRKVAFAALVSAVAGWSAPSSALELTAAHVNPPGEPSNVAFAELSKLLEKSETGLSLTVFPQGQIGGEKDAIRQVKLGAITMTTVSNSNLSSFAPSVGVFDLPYLFRDATEHPRKVVQGPIGDEMAKKVLDEAGVELLGWWSAGIRHVFTTDVDVKTPEDMKGLKIRVIGNPVYLDAYNAVGAQATPMPYGEVYTSLATGAIDAADNDSSGYRNMKFWEQAPHLSLTGMFFLFKPVVANKDVMDSMTPEQRAEFDKVFAKATDHQWDLFASNFKDDLEFLKEKGVTITEPDRAAFEKAVEPVLEKYQKTYGADLVERIKATK